MSDPITRLNAALEGRYRIERELGQGGMATVYLAEDIKHERKVALKVLKPELAAVVGAERFLAEIKTTAHLQHPHILPLHDSGEADSFLYYVMPFVEGESLRERLDRDHQLPVGEAVHIATAVVNALDYAHRHDVIHRDIKPANILLQDGEPVVADFGIALAVGSAGADRLTETGLSVGTPYYMSPEQATGDQHVGPPSDTYSVGCVLYEMLVGEPPYAGSTAQAVLGKIIQGLPVSAAATRKSVPANVDAAIRRALEKLPADRFTETQDFARALADEGFRHGEVATTSAGEAVGPWKRRAMAFAALAAVATLAFGWALSRSPPRLVVRSSLTLAQGQELSAVGDQPIALSPDGSTLVYSGEFQLWQRPLNQLQSQPIPGTDQGRNPVVSPDGTSVAFTALGSLKTVPLLGGPPFTVVPSGVGATGLDWASDGMLYFTSAEGAIHRVPASGGEPELITTNAPGTRHGWMDVLPDGRGLLFSIMHGAPDPNEIAVIGFDGIVRPLPAGVNARYSNSGHIVFAAANGSLQSAPFDAKRLAVTGPSVALVDIVDASGGNVFAFALSEAGAMVYAPQGSGATEVVPVWVERDGSVQEIDPEWRGLGNPAQSSLALSPDGTRLAISLRDLGGRYDLWVKQLDTGPAVRLTSEGTFNRRASWSLDGRSLFFMSNRAGAFDLWTQRADRSSTAELVMDINEQIYEALYSPDGTWLVFRVAADDIYAFRTTMDSLRVPLVVTASENRYIALSPNGRWLAYVSNESDREQVYVRPFPYADSARVQVSTAGGREPVWSHSGSELFYRNGANQMVVAQVTEEPSFDVGGQQVLFSMANYLTSNGHRQYDVSPDDQRFVMLRIVGDRAVGAQLVLVQNFFEELRQLAPN